MCIYWNEKCKQILYFLKYQIYIYPAPADAKTKIIILFCIVSCLRIN